MASNIDKLKREALAARVTWNFQMPAEAPALDKLHAALVKSAPVRAVIDAIRALPKRDTWQGPEGFGFRPAPKMEDYSAIVDAFAIHLLDAMNETRGGRAHKMLDAAHEAENLATWFAEAAEAAKAEE